MALAGHELVGARIVGRLPSDDMVLLWRTVCSGIVKRGFAIEYRDLEPPRTGIFDGLRIVIDPTKARWRLPSHCDRANLRCLRENEGGGARTPPIK